MRNLVILFVHVMATLARLLGPGGIRSVVAESVLAKQQLLILNRSRQRSPNLRTSDRLVAGLCALLVRPDRRRYRTETFCYGHLSCSSYKPGPTRKVPGRHDMTYEEEDWVDHDATAHRGPNE